MTVHMVFSTYISLARTHYFCSPSLNYSLHREYAADNCDVLALTFSEKTLFICFNPQLSRFSSCFPWSCSKLKYSGIKVRFYFFYCKALQLFRLSSTCKSKHCSQSLTFLLFKCDVKTSRGWFNSNFYSLHGVLLDFRSNDNLQGKQLSTT